LGLKFTRTGDTLVGLKDNQIILKGIKPPQAVFFCSVVPESPQQEESLNVALNTLQLEDPSFQFYSNKETGQLLIGGMGELHLEIIRDRLAKHFKVNVDIGALYVAYRSTVEDTAKDTYTKTFMTAAGKLENATVTLQVSRNSGSTNQFQISDYLNLASIIENNKIANDIRDAFKEGAKDAFTNGIPSGFPFHDISVELVNFKYDKSTSAQTYRNAILQGILAIAKKKHRQ